MIFSFISLTGSRFVNAVILLLMVPFLLSVIGLKGYGLYALFQVYAGYIFALFTGVSTYVLTQSSRLEGNESFKLNNEISRKQLQNFHLWLVYLFCSASLLFL